MKVIVVTNVELGWDCVVGVYTDKKFAKKQHKGKEYTFTKTKVIKKKFKRKPILETTEKYTFLSDKEIKEKKLKEIYQYTLICDTCDIIQNGKNLGNSRESILLIAEKYNDFTDNKYNFYIIKTKDSNKFYLLINVDCNDYEDDSIEFRNYLEKLNIDIN